MNEAEIRKQVEAEIVAWLVERGNDCGDFRVFEREAILTVANEIRHGLYYPAIDRMKLGVQDGRE